MPTVQSRPGIAKGSGILTTRGVREQGSYRWKTKYARPGVSGLREMQQLCGEKRKLKQVAAGLTLDKDILAGGDARKAVKPAAKRAMARWAEQARRVPGRHVCRLFRLERTLFQPQVSENGAPTSATRAGSDASAPGYRRLTVPLRREDTPLSLPNCSGLARASYGLKSSRRGTRRCSDAPTVRPLFVFNTVTSN